METSKKKTLGRRKIEIKKIEKKSTLQVTFSKRRGGLFRKASELSILCGAQIAILVQSPADKMYAFGHPSVGALIDNSPAITPQGGNDGRMKYEKAAEMLEMEKRLMAGKEAKGFWWEEEIEGLELHQLEEFLAGLEGLMKNVDGKAEELRFMGILG